MDVHSETDHLLFAHSSILNTCYYRVKIKATISILKAALVVVEQV